MKRILFFLVTLISFSLASQTSSGDLQSYLQNYLSNIPGDSGNDYQIPTNQNMIDWENCLTALLADNIAVARTEANKVNYQIVEYTHTGTTPFISYVLEEKSPATNHWGTYVFNKNLTTKLVIQAPHSLFDFNTGKQAIYSYVNYMDAFLFLNGTHRCNHSQASTCSGTTSVCNDSSEAFKISDLAHNNNSFWQKATEVVYNTVSNSTFVQLHGFTKLASDPYVIISNGTNITPNGNDLALAIETSLGNYDNTLTFKVAHRDNWTRLVGFTNTQGRFINNSNNPCSSSATETTGRFIHIEQEKSKLRQDETGWETMYNALLQVFNPAFSVDDVVKISFISENPFDDSIEFTVDNDKEIGIFLF